MKLLLDQNISFRVIPLLLATFPEAQQVRDLELTDASDIEIWNYAKQNSYTIVTFDYDFIDLSNLKGSPPKIIWLRLGNSSNLKIAHKLISNAENISDFVFNKPEISFLEID